jgi:MFS family permease
VSSPKDKSSLGATFNKIWSAAMFSKFADGLFGAAIPLLAASLTRDPVLISIQSNMMLLPWLFFAIPLGALVDRLNRRTAMVLVQVSRVLIGATIASLVLSGDMTLWILMLLTFTFGVSEVVYDTATQSTIPSLLKGHQLERGNSRLQMADTVMQSFIGIPLGAVLYSALAFSPFLGISLCYLVAIFLILSLTKTALQTEVKETKREKLSVEIKEGLIYLWQDKVLFRLVLTTGIDGMFFALASSTSVLFILDKLKVPEVHFGWVMLPLAVGALLGAFLSPSLSAKFGRSQTLSVALVSACFPILVSGLFPNITVYLICGFVQGFFIAQWNILLMSTYHQMIPNEIFGRIHGARRTLVWGVMPIGAYFGGLLASIDLTLPLIVGGLGAFLVAGSQAKFIASIRA